MIMDKTGLMALIILGVLCTGTVGAYVYNEYAPEPVLVAAKGDTVNVWYEGRYASNGTLFDTNVYDAAKEASEMGNFTLRPKSSYTPLAFTIGEGQMIKGFDEAVVGMKEGGTKTVVIEPQDAYGNKTITFDFERVTKFNVTETLPADQFNYMAGTENYSVGDTFPHYTGAWNITVTEMTGDGVTFSAIDAEEGWVGGIYQWWNSTISSVDEMEITVRHDPEVGLTFEARPNYFSPPIEYTIIELDDENILIGYDNTHNLAGETLEFTITMDSIEKGES